MCPPPCAGRHEQAKVCEVRPHDLDQRRRPSSYQGGANAECKTSRQTPESTRRGVYCEALNKQRKCGLRALRNEFTIRESATGPRCAPVIIQPRLQVICFPIIFLSPFRDPTRRIQGSHAASAVWRTASLRFLPSQNRRERRG